MGAAHGSLTVHHRVGHRRRDAVLVGVLLIGFGVVRAARGRGGIVRGAIGGAIGGAGALLLSQQFGWIGITPTELVSWVVAPAFGGAAITGLTSLMSGGAAAGSGASGAGAAGGGAAAAPTTGCAVRSATTGCATTARRAAPPPTAAPTHRRPRRFRVRRPRRRSRCRGSVPRRIRRGVRTRGMDAPEAVVAGDEFMLIVGLAPEPVAGVINPQIVRPESSVGPYTLDIQVVADGFSLTEGEWRRQLPVTAAAAYPTTTYKLRADAQPADVWSRPIQALYSIDGQTVGVAIRTIAIVAHAELLHSAPVPVPATASVIAVAPQKDAPDLTARITYSEAVSDGRLLWTFETTHDIPIPPEEIVTDVGRRPQIFASELIAGVASHRGDPGLVEFLIGIGRTVSEKVPEEFFTLLAAVAAKLDRPPRVLLLGPRAVRTVGARDRRARARCERAAVPRRAGRCRPMGVRPAPPGAAAAHRSRRA